MVKRVFLIVLDSLGIGEMPDASLFSDVGSNTLGSIRNDSNFCCPNLQRLGLFNIDGVGGGQDGVIGSYALMSEKSIGKDTTVGHWEIMGLISQKPLPTFPNGFPNEIIKRFEELTGREILCNKPYSGTEVIKDYGEEHIKTGKLIVYTSADSVFQVAAHEDIVPVNELYRYCELARDMLKGEYGVGRVIARPFTGKYPFERTANRHDFSLMPPSDTHVDLLRKAGLDTISVGKIYDIFGGKGFTQKVRTVSNYDGMKKTIDIAENDFNGLCFINLVEFDSAFGHRNNITGYAKAMSEFDVQLGEFLKLLRNDDVLIITADHGCDPGTPSTDHSREYTPMIVYGSSVKPGVNLGTRQCFADIGATVLDMFGVSKENTAGESFWSKVKYDDRL